MNKRKKSTLSYFFKTIVNSRITIETQNNDSITGTVKNVDDKLNFDLVDVWYKSHRPIFVLSKSTINNNVDPTFYDSLVVSGRHVRYVQFSEQYNIGDNMKKQKQKEEEGKERYKRQTIKPKVQARPPSTKTRAEKPIIHDAFGKRKRDEVQ
ncbi:hypothetical protein AKO1_007175 [Acrasis kona]|uniref:Sm domain-containing protein n=1 Tax=Acrasis kona TaxID=1008807 RepID=A0AAW2YT05_9EUKA